MKILITGCSGYIGSHFVQMLKKDQMCEIYGLDKTSPQVELNDHFYDDIRYSASMWSSEKIEYDYVIHMAAEVAVGRSVIDPILYYQTNISGTLNVLNKLKFKNFILTSTGSAAELNNPYGISKKAAEEIVEQYCKENKIPYTIFRFYNVVGTENFSPTNPDGLMWNLLNAKESGVFKLFGNDYNTEDGSCVRDYVHVNEICYSVIQSIGNLTNTIENLGHGVGTTVLQMIATFKKVNACDFEVVNVGRRAGDSEKSVLSHPSKFMKHLYTMEDLLKL